MAKSKPEYDGGTVIHVISRDEDGTPTEHVERDHTGQHWHLVAGAEPVAISGEDARALHEADARG